MPYSLAEFNRRVNISGESRATIRKAGRGAPAPALMRDALRET